MLKYLAGFSSFVRAIAGLLLVLLLSAGGWLGYQAYDERARLDRELAAKTEELAAKTAEIDRLTQENHKLNLAIRLLKIDHRVAEIRVLEQREGAERPQTKFQFVELNKNSDPLGPAKTFTIEGDTIYVDAWVIKYIDELIEKGDPLRSTSVCLFRRIFGEYQEPSQGFVIDTAGSQPAIYSQGEELSPIERDIWANFWEYANSPGKARKAGVRAAHGEAPSIKLEPGKTYRVELRASGGLSIVAEDGPSGPAT